MTNNPNMMYGPGMSGTTPFGNPMEYGKEQAKDSKAGGWIALGSALGTGIGQMIPEQYNQNIGMAKPNFGREMLNMQYTGMGASIGGPWGALIGGIIDTGKNIGTYFNKQAKYNTALNRWENTEAQEQRMNAMLPDYTNYSRYGSEACSPYMKMAHGGGVPVEIERNELVVMPQQDGSYQMLGGTGSNAPTHEQGGVKTQLPQGALVFPKQYIPRVMEYMRNGDWVGMDGIKEEMLTNANQAAMNGEPYSSGGMFGDGGRVLAEKVKAYKHEDDTDGKIAKSMLEEFLTAQGKGEITNDERDYMTMGLISKINPDETYATYLRDKHKQYYDYFHGQGEYMTPPELPDVIDMEGTNTFNQVSGHTPVDNIKYIWRQMGIGDDGVKSPYANKSKTQTNTTQQTTPSTQQTNTQGTGSNPQATTPMDRTGTRHAAMQAGIYQAQDGTPLTFWDESTGKRMFTAAAKKYGLEGDVMAVIGSGQKPTTAVNQKLQKWDYTNNKPASDATPVTPAAPVTTTPTKPAYANTPNAPKVQTPKTEEQTESTAEANREKTAEEESGVMMPKGGYYNSIMEQMMKSDRNTTTPTTTPYLKSGKAGHEAQETEWYNTGMEVTEGMKPKIDVAAANQEFNRQPFANAVISELGKHSDNYKRKAITNYIQGLSNTVPWQVTGTSMDSTTRQAIEQAREWTLKLKNNR